MVQRIILTTTESPDHLKIKNRDI